MSELCSRLKKVHQKLPRYATGGTPEEKMAKRNRKERRKHLQPELGTEKKDRQLITELDLVEPTENADEPQEKTGFAAFKAGYEA